MRSMNTRRRISIAIACAALFLACMARAALPEEGTQSIFKMLGPIPSDIKNTGIYFNLDKNYGAYKGPDCLRYRSGVYNGLKRVQRKMHATLGENFRHAIKAAQQEKADTKDPKRKKQIGEWETKLSEAVHKMHRQIDDEYAAAVKNVHFRVLCSDK